jgi:penicillin-binding protein A
VVTATIAQRGRRPTPTLLAGARPRFTRAVPARTARSVARGMRAVVQEGTGTSAAIGGVGVAGKTGTAELEDTTDEEDIEQTPGSDTDAWFTAYAPVKNPKIAVAVLLVRNGAGGETAAPAARVVLQAALTD